MSAGWVHPIGRLLKDGIITVDQCNAIVKAVSKSFDSMCLPGALTSFYNPFGELQQRVSKLWPQLLEMVWYLIENLSKNSLSSFPLFLFFKKLSTELV